MDLCEGGELFDRIIKKGNLTENEARFYMKQLLSAIQHCHANNIMHRDLKPENIMFLNDKAKDIKLIDFGVSTTYESDKKTTLRVGSVRLGSFRFIIWLQRSFKKSIMRNAMCGLLELSCTSS